MLNRFNDETTVTDYMLKFIKLALKQLQDLEKKELNAKGSKLGKGTLSKNNTASLSNLPPSPPKRRLTKQ